MDIRRRFQGWKEKKAPSCLASRMLQQVCLHKSSVSRCQACSPPQGLRGSPAHLPGPEQAVCACDKAAKQLSMRSTAKLLSRFCRALGKQQQPKPQAAAAPCTRSGSQSFATCGDPRGPRLYRTLETDPYTNLKGSRIKPLTIILAQL